MSKLPENPKFPLHNFLFMEERTYEDVAKLRELLKNYLALNLTPSISGLCAFLGITKEYFNKLSSKKEFSVLIDSFKLILEADRTDGLLTGRYAASGAIFDLKANFGWNDKIEEVSKLEISQIPTINIVGVPARERVDPQITDRLKNNDL